MKRRFVPRPFGEPRGTLTADEYAVQSNKAAVKRKAKADADANAFIAEVRARIRNKEK